MGNCDNFADTYCFSGKSNLKIHPIKLLNIDCSLQSDIFKKQTREFPKYKKQNKQQNYRVSRSPCKF